MMVLARYRYIPALGFIETNFKFSMKINKCIYVKTLVMYIQVAYKIITNTIFNTSINTDLVVFCRFSNISLLLLNMIIVILTSHKVPISHLKAYALYGQSISRTCHIT